MSDKVARSDAYGGSTQLNGSDSTTLDDLTPRSMEAELRVRLRGCRLVLEARLDDETVTSTAAAVRMVVRDHESPAQSLAVDYPAILATYLVAIGIYRYDGDYWPHLTEEDLDQSVLKQGFLTALRRLHLETFADLDEKEGWHRFVGPILAHGGIPKHSLGDFFRVLLRDLRRFGSSSAEELVALWRTRDTAFENVDRPVRRFLLYGGGPAVDFLDRCISLAHLSRAQVTAMEAAEIGLPAHVVEAYLAAVGSYQQAIGRSAGSTTVPRPRVRLDPWDRLGPILELPVTPAQLRGSRWIVNSGDRTRELDASIFDETIIPLGPAPVWEVEFASPAVGRTFAFECLGTTPFVCFDPSGGTYLDDARPLTVESVWLLAPAGAKIEAVDRAGSTRAAEVIAQLPPPMGAWRGFDLVHASLGDAIQLRVTIDSPSGPTEALLRVGRSQDRPSIIGETIAGVWSTDGLPVYADVPRIRLPAIPGVELDRWAVSVASSAGRMAATADELTSHGDILDIGRLVPGTGPVELEVHVRGPLGSDLRTAIVVVPGLDIERPAEVILPKDERSLQIRVSAGDRVSIEGGPMGAAVEVPVPVGSAVVQVLTSGGDVAVGLRIGVPKLTWALMHRNGIGSLSTQFVAVDRDDLESGDAQSILVSTGVADTQVMISVEADSRPLSESAWERTGGAEGRWAADLAPFRDAVRLSSESRLEIALAISAGRCLAGYVVTKVVASEIVATFDEAADLLEIGFVQGRPLSRRVARLWSRQRPWQSALAIPIADGVDGTIAVVAEGFKPGEYRVQIAIDDPWFPASRPRRGADGTADLMVGSIEAVTRARRALEFGSPLELLELAVVTGRVPKELDETDLPGLAPEALVAAAELLSDQGVDGEGRALAVVTRMLFIDAGLAIQAITKAMRVDSVDATVVAALSIRALPNLGVVRGVDDRDLRQVWQAAPSLGAFADIPAAIGGDPEALDRCGQFIGWRPGDDPPPPRPGQERVYLRMPPVQLRTIRDVIGLVPQQAIAYDTYAVANLEWLAAAAEDPRPIGRWWQRFGWLATESLGAGMPNEYLAARKAGYDPDYSWRDLPQAILAAAFHVAARTDSAPEAVQALQLAVGFASRLVQHDLVLGRVLIARPSEERLDVDGEE